MKIGCKTMGSQMCKPPWYWLVVLSDYVQTNKNSLYVLNRLPWYAVLTCWRQTILLVINLMSIWRHFDVKSLTSLVWRRILCQFYIKTLTSIVWHQIWRYFHIKTLTMKKIFQKIIKTLTNYWHHIDINSLTSNMMSI